jgi:hypothetical protein
MSIAHRVRQTLAALTSRPDEPCRELVARHLTSAQAAGFNELTPYERAHGCRVCARTLDYKAAGPDLIAAALLHDIGKVSERGRVHLADRIVKVLLSRISPAILQRIAARPAPRLLEGISLAVHHPALGAAKAADLGCSTRTCWLIAHHEHKPPLSDYDLCLLVATDRETV